MFIGITNNSRFERNNVTSSRILSLRSDLILRIWPVRGLACHRLDPPHKHEVFIRRVNAEGSITLVFFLI